MSGGILPPPPYAFMFCRAKQLPHFTCKTGFVKEADRGLHAASKVL
jgi:hypothetical protein